MSEKMRGETPEPKKESARDQGMAWANQPSRGFAWPLTPDKAPKTLGRLAPDDVPAFAEGVVEFLRSRREAQWMAERTYAEKQIKEGERLLASGKTTWPAVWETTDTRSPASSDERREERGALTRKMIAPPGGDIRSDIASARKKIEAEAPSPSRAETAWTRFAQTATQSKEK